jgi:hypothetical protein
MCTVWPASAFTTSGCSAYWSFSRSRPSSTICSRSPGRTTVETCTQALSARSNGSTTRSRRSPAIASITSSAAATAATP